MSAASECPGSSLLLPTVTVQSKKGYSGRVTASVQGGVYVFLDSKSPWSCELSDSPPAGRMAMGAGRGRERSRPHRVPVGTAGPSNSRSRREGLCSEQPPPPSLKEEVVFVSVPLPIPGLPVGLPAGSAELADIPVGLQPPPPSDAQCCKCQAFQQNASYPCPSPSHLGVHKFCFTDRGPKATRHLSLKIPNLPSRARPGSLTWLTLRHLGRAQPLF